MYPARSTLRPPHAVHAARARAQAQVERHVNLSSQRVGVGNEERDGMMRDRQRSTTVAQAEGQGSDGSKEWSGAPTGESRRCYDGRKLPAHVHVRSLPLH